ncbi:MAG: TRAG family protein [Desulfotomaculum sp. BICA1-6]|nr:MAG: TRAG family protein [Desulfotomaculum sp. BICA1-6]
MKTRAKLMICSLIFLTGGFVNLFFSTAIHGLLSRQMTVLKLLPIGECLASLFSSKQHFLLYLCLQGFMLILAVMYFLTNLRPYQSDLTEITPDIKTPVAVGQYQHGSARWLKDDEKDKAFASFALNPHNKVIKALIKGGYDNIDFLKNKTDKEKEVEDDISSQDNP